MTGHVDLASKVKSRARATRFLLAAGMLTGALSASFGASAAEAPTEEVLQMCREDLSSKRGAVLIDAWLAKPLPAEYRKAAKFEFRHDTVGGWIVHRNPNGTFTVVIRMIDPETGERHFIFLVKDTRLALKVDVSAFEFALSRDAHDGVTGLFFCNKTGSSAEWLWDGSDWKISK